MLIIKNEDTLSIQKRCDLLEVNRANIYYKSIDLSKTNTDLMNLIYDIWLKRPFYGYRKITSTLQKSGLAVNHKRVFRLMRHMGIQSIYPKKKNNILNQNKVIYPYLLNNVIINRPNQVWSTDLTYLRMQQGFMYLIAIIDLFSRYIISWRLLNTMEAINCVDALKEALNINIPDIFNTDHGSQFTSTSWIECLLNNKVQISMNGKGRCFDNIYIERLWRTIKYEDFYLNCYEDGWDLEKGLNDFVLFYNDERPHQSLYYKTPAEIYFAKGGAIK